MCFLSCGLCFLYLDLGESGDGEEDGFGEEEDIGVLVGLLTGILGVPDGSCRSNCQNILKGSFFMRKYVSLFLFFDLIIMAFSGIVLYITPHGRVAYWYNSGYTPYDLVEELKRLKTSSP